MRGVHLLIRNSYERTNRLDREIFDAKSNDLNPVTCHRKEVDECDLDHNVDIIGVDKSKDYVEQSFFANRVSDMNRRKCAGEMFGDYIYRGKNHFITDIRNNGLIVVPEIDPEDITNNGCAEYDNHKDIGITFHTKNKDDCI